MAATKSQGLLNTADHIIDRFLCKALRGVPTPWVEWPAEVDVGRVNERCAHHGVQSLLYHAMYGHPEWSAWPATLRQDLAAASKAGIAQEMLRSHYLKKLLDGFAARQIRCILLKGEALARTHYPGPGTRWRADSDVFINLLDIEDARRTALDAGFGIVSPVYKSHQFKVHRKLDGADVVEFDLHWRILNNPGYARVLSFEQAFERSLPTPGLDHVRVLHPVDALIHACLHRVASDTHDRDRLIWSHDIHVLLAAMTPDEVDSFAEQAVQKGVQAACLDGMRAAHACLNTEWPQEVTAILEQPTRAPGLRQRFSESNLGLLLDDWKHLPDTRARRALLGELLFPSPDSLFRKYGTTQRLWLPLLYVRHLVGGLSARLTLR